MINVKLMQRVASDEYRPRKCSNFNFFADVKLLILSEATLKHNFEEFELSNKIRRTVLNDQTGY